MVAQHPHSTPQDFRASTRATARQLLLQALLVAGVVFLASGLGILTRPESQLATFWPTNALLLGLYQLLGQRTQCLDHARRPSGKLLRIRVDERVLIGPWALTQIEAQVLHRKHSDLDACQRGEPCAKAIGDLARA